jgi:hypothetical protein
LQTEENAADAPSNARTNARKNQSKYPRAIEANARKTAKQMPGKIQANARETETQMPGISTGHFDQVDQASDWSDLWRIEKDGDSNYRWRLRFTKARKSRPGGRIDSGIRKLLKARPGKGRHAESRRDAERLRSAAEYLEISLRPGDPVRAFGQIDPTANARRDTGPDNPDTQRDQMPEVHGLVDWEGMPDLPVM